MRVVLATWGSLGDFYPMLALAVRLKELGHAPVLATCAFYRQRTAEAGIGFHAVRPDVDPADAETIRRVMDPSRGTEVVLRELLAPRIRESYEDLSAAADGADVLVSHPVTFAAPLVAAAKGLPWLSVVLAPASLFSVHDFPVFPPYPQIMRLARSSPWVARLFMRLARRVTRPWMTPVSALRDELGLPDRGDPVYEGQFSPSGTLALFSPIFGPPQPDWPPSTVATGFVFPSEAAELAAPIAEFLDRGEPPVVFTLGSSAVGAAGSFYAESVKAAAAIGRRAILLAGTDPRNRSTTPLPPSMLAVEYAPHGALFPRAAAIVHHGGIGTTAQVLRAGRPMLVVPHAHDQPDNADRARRLGVARVVDAGSYRADRAVRHLRALLGQDGYARRAADIGGRIAEEDGLGQAAAAIAALGEYGRGLPVS